MIGIRYPVLPRLRQPLPRPKAPGSPQSGTGTALLKSSIYGGSGVSVVVISVTPTLPRGGQRAGHIHSFRGTEPDWRHSREQKNILTAGIRESSKCSSTSIPCIDLRG